MQIFCDFDGTISIQDTTDVILSRFADPAWETIEEEWSRGEIGSAECMRKQIPLIRATKQELNAALDEMPIDPAFPEFVRFCEQLAAPLTVISDGVDYFINRILTRYQLGHLPIIANTLSIDSDGSYRLACPHTNQSCAAAAGVCKCRQIGSRTGLRVFVGDGRSDYCAADSADVLFAKSSLATYCEQKSIAYIAYENFADVQCSLQQTLTEIAHREPETYAYATA